MDCFNRITSRGSQKTTVLIALAFLLLCSAACKKNGQKPELPNARTLLVYMAGDNDLYSETTEKIGALKNSYVKGMGRLLIYQDAAGQAPRLLEISCGNAGSTIRTIRNYPEGNSAGSSVFRQVMNDVQAEAPATSYGLIFFSHASGWLPQRTLNKPYAVARDGINDLELPDFASAIPDGFFDFMVFEACFMSGIEVAYELKDKTKYIVSSSTEILSPGFTPIYPQLLPLVYQPGAGLENFAAMFFSYYNKMAGESRSATVSVIRTGALPALAAWVRQYASGIVWPASELKTVQHYDRYPDYSLFFDFEDYYQRISPSSAHAGLRLLINNAVIYKAATPAFMRAYDGFEIIHFSGLTSYIPQQDFHFLNEQYKELKWSKAIINGK